MTFLSHTMLNRTIASCIVSTLIFSTTSVNAIEAVNDSANEAPIKTVPIKTASKKEAVHSKETAHSKEKNTAKENIEQVESVPFPEECDDDVIDFSIGNNSRDGFFLGLSAISSVGDDFYFPETTEDNATFDMDISYRVQLASLFIESPGLSSRRIHGMYSLPAWGVNFYDNDDWSFDLFYQYSTRGSKGLEGIQMRNEDERAGLRISGYLESSQFQFIYSPVSRNSEGSDGIVASLSYSYSGQLRNWTYFADVGVQYRSKEVTPYHGYEYSELPENTNKGTNAGLSYNAKVGLEYPLTTDWVFSGFVAYNALSDRSISYRQHYMKDNIEDGYRAGLLLSFIF